MNVSSGEHVSAYALFGAADIPADGGFNTETFRHGDFSCTGNFWHLDFLAQEHFGKGIFWYPGCSVTRGLFDTEIF